MTMSRRSFFKRTAAVAVAPAFVWKRPESVPMPLIEQAPLPEHIPFPEPMVGPASATAIMPISHSQVEVWLDDLDLSKHVTDVEARNQVVSDFDFTRMLSSDGYHEYRERYLPRSYDVELRLRFSHEELERTDRNLLADIDQKFVTGLPVKTRMTFSHQEWIKGDFHIVKAMTSHDVEMHFVRVDLSLSAVGPVTVGIEGEK